MLTLILHIDVGDREVYAEVARQLADFGRLEPAHLAGGLCDVVTLVLDVLLGICRHFLVFFVNAVLLFHVFSQNTFVCCREFTHGALVILYFIMDCLNVPP